MGNTKSLGNSSSFRVIPVAECDKLNVRQPPKNWQVDTLRNIASADYSDCDFFHWCLLSLKWCAQQMRGEYYANSKKVPIDDGIRKTEYSICSQKRNGGDFCFALAAT
jgi:hypothetical protein